MCTQKKVRVEECQGKKEIPSDVVYQGMDWVEPQFASRNKSLLSMCIQYEQNGACQVCSSSDSWCHLQVVIHVWCLEEVFKSFILV